MPISLEYVLLTSSKIGACLAREQGVFGNVCSARVGVKRKEKQPDYTDNNTEGRQEWEDG